MLAKECGSIFGIHPAVQVLQIDRDARQPPRRDSRCRSRLLGRTRPRFVIESPKVRSVDGHCGEGTWRSTGQTLPDENQILNARLFGIGMASCP